MKQQGKISAEYKNLVPDIIANGNYSQEEKELINKGLEPNANNKDRLIALGLLNLGDVKISADYAAIHRHDLKWYLQKAQTDKDIDLWFKRLHRLAYHTSLYSKKC